MKAIVSIYDDDNRPIRENWLIEPYDDRITEDCSSQAAVKRTYFRFQVEELLDIGGIIRGEAKNENN